ncbi:FkbM family methyltransferase [Rhizobium sp. DKSPLA3]|uniref:FkbM family methyltransferase n=1 Tax=Rhizobium quercicola TaxID=2901226 RepID=A0A9X1T7B7_9HYPH|nr:FkbM family methyltransferase [Rhizobium quercicola]MCD7109678.1 FkbM family methyltransferase [Rhizobium quercicola]
MKRQISICDTSFTVEDTGTGFWDNLSNGIWEYDTLQTIKQLVGPRSLFIDVGAWIGPITLLAASCGANVVSFEPDPAAYEELQNNLAANQPAFENVITINSAIGSAAEEITLYTRRAGNSETSIFQTHERFGENVECTESFKVKMLDLRSEIANRYRAERHDNIIVKIDVEGAEFHFFADVAPYLASIGATILLSTHSFNIVERTEEATTLSRIKAKSTVVEAALVFDWFVRDGDSLTQVDKKESIAHSFANIDKADNYILRRDQSLKVYVENGEPSILQDPVLGFPFSHLPEVMPATSAEEADFIFAFFPCPYTIEANDTARMIRETDSYRNYREKYVWQSLCDFPDFSRSDPAGHKLVLSPLPAKNLNIRYNVHPMPIHPCEGDYQIQMDREHTEDCRSLAKIYDFAFLGSVDDFPVTGGFFGGRAWLRQLEAEGLPNFFLRSAKGWAFSEDWADRHREWMKRVGEAKYGFAPADSSNSPRLFWTMQVGTVPIITDYEHLPFDDVVDWSSLAVVVPSSQKLTFDYRSLPTSGPDYDLKRERVIKFWEEYCFYPNAARKLVNRIRSSITHVAAQ